MSLETIRETVHARLLNMRNVHHTVMSDDFEIIFRILNIREKRELNRLIELNDKKGIQNFIKQRLLKLTPFHNMSHTKLREIARHNSIPDYWLKKKTTLIREIEDVIKRLKAGVK